MLCFTVFALMFSSVINIYVCVITPTCRQDSSILNLALDTNDCVTQNQYK